MTVTVEVINEKTIDMLNVMESMGLIHMQSSVQQNAEKPMREGRRTLEQMRGIHAGHHGRTLDDFLRECHEEKERENEIDRRMDEERERMRNAKLPS